jgi:hypothetical protein
MIGSTLGGGIAGVGTLSAGTTPAGGSPSGAAPAAASEDPEAAARAARRARKAAKAARLRALLEAEQRKAAEGVMACLPLVAAASSGGGGPPGSAGGAGSHGYSPAGVPVGSVLMPAAAAPGAGVSPDGHVYIQQYQGGPSAVPVPHPLGVPHPGVQYSTAVGGIVPGLQPIQPHRPGSRADVSGLQYAKQRGIYRSDAPSWSVLPCALLPACVSVVLLLPAWGLGEVSCCVTQLHGSEELQRNGTMLS